MQVKIHNQLASEPVEYPNAIGCFQKGDMFCVYFYDSNSNKITHKYPLQHIFRVENSYTQVDHGENKNEI